jgi:hypothetical protein
MGDDRTNEDRMQHPFDGSVGEEEGLTGQQLGVFGPIDFVSKQSSGHAREPNSVSDEHPVPESTDEITHNLHGVLSRHAARRTTLTYDELRLATGATGDLVPILRSISQSEEEAGRGLLTAVVVRSDTALPGRGWFRLAAEKGRDLSDPERCWGAEIDDLHRIWSSRIS